MMFGRKKVTGAAYAILLAYIIFSITGLFLTSCFPFHKYLSDRHSNIHNDTILKNTIAYLDYGSQLDSSFFSGQALEHMQDVRHLIIIWKVSVLAALIGLVVVFWLFKGISVEAMLMQSAYFGIAAVALLLLISLNFSLSFEAFHRLFFANSLWLFPYDDSIVNLYTEDFFKWFFITWLSLYAAVCIAVIAFDNIYKKCRKYTKS